MACYPPSILAPLEFSKARLWTPTSWFMNYDQIWSKDQKFVINDISNLTLNRHLKLQYNNFTAYVKYDIFSEAKKNLVKLQEEKERENICYTCDVFQHVKNQLELMTWNWIIPIIPIACAKILLLFELCAKKVVKVQQWFQLRKLFTWCFDEIFGSITKGHSDCKTQV